MKKILFVVMACVLCLGMVGGAFAYFTDTATSTANTFASGTLDVDVNGDTDDSFDIVVGTVNNMAPGDITGTIEIKVKNVGSLPAATFARFTFDNDSGLGAALDVYDWQATYFNGNDTANSRWGAGDDPYFGVGSNMDWFVQNGVAGFNMGSNVLNLDVGDVISGDRAFDAEALPAGAYYILKVKFQMDPTAGNEYQDKSVDVAFEVYATQVNSDAIDALGTIIGADGVGITGASFYAYFNTQLTTQYP